MQIDGRIIITTGATGTGKTTLMKSILSKINLPKRFFDPDQEYKELGSQPLPNGKKIKDAIIPFKTSVCRLERHAIVFSEAGIYMTHAEGDDMEMRELLKSARRRGNWLFFDFHTLSEVPLWMLRYCNYLYIKKTVMESPSQIRKWRDYPQVMAARQKVQGSSNNFETVLINPRNLNIEI